MQKQLSKRKKKILRILLIVLGAVLVYMAFAVYIYLSSSSSP